MTLRLRAGTTSPLRFNLPVGKISSAHGRVKRPRPGGGEETGRRAIVLGVKAKIATSSKPHWKAFATRRRDPESKREAVLQTAAELFLEKGFSRTLMNDVAERLSITKPALYHYFSNKEDMLWVIYRLGDGLID
jgi:hypothetical protein